MIQAYFKGKLVIQDNCVKKNEDLKTSSSIGLLQYLPDEVFWKILRSSCVGFPEMDFGKILSFNFWSHNDATNTNNSLFVEPDVWIETEKYDVIIEAKVCEEYGNYMQSEVQWNDEIISLRNEQEKMGYSKPIIMIALGGNDNMMPDSAMDCPVYKASWYNLMNAVVNEQTTQNDKGWVCRILDDIIEMLARQGVIKVEWLKTLPEKRYTVKEHSLDIWAKHKLGFFTIHNMIIKETIIQQWKSINQ